MGSAGQGVGRLVGYATHAGVAWMYGPVQLGFYAVGITVVKVASILSQLGLDNGMVRYVAYHGAGGDTARGRGTILQSLAVTLTLSVALSSLLFVRHRLGFWPYGRRYARPLLAGLVAAAVTLASRHLILSLAGLPALLLFVPLTLAVFFSALVCLGLYPSDRLVLASFGGALEDTFRRKTVR